MIILIIGVFSSVPASAGGYIAHRAPWAVHCDVVNAAVSREFGIIEIVVFALMTVSWGERFGDWQ